MSMFLLLLSLLVLPGLGFPDADIHWDFMLSSNRGGIDVKSGILIINDEERNQNSCANDADAG